MGWRRLRVDSGGLGEAGEAGEALHVDTVSTCLNRKLCQLPSLHVYFFFRVSLFPSTPQSEGKACFS